MHLQDHGLVHLSGMEELVDKWGFYTEYRGKETLSRERERYRDRNIEIKSAVRVVRHKN